LFTLSVFSILVLLASFKLSTLGVRRPSRIPYLLDCYSTRQTFAQSHVFAVVNCSIVAVSVFAPLFWCAALYFCSC